MLEVEEIIARLGLRPLPDEGGYYAQTYRSASLVAPGALPAGYPLTARPFGTAIYYLLTAEPDSFSALHRLRGDEIYHFYLGDPVEMLLLHADGSGHTLIMGQDLRAGQVVQHVAPGGVWQGSRLARGGRYALLGTTMAPGYDPVDFELGSRAALCAAYPAWQEQVIRLTRT